MMGFAVAQPILQRARADKLIAAFAVNFRRTRSPPIGKRRRSVHGFHDAPRCRPAQLGVVAEALGPHAFIGRSEMLPFDRTVRMCCFAGIWPGHWAEKE